MIKSKKKLIFLFIILSAFIYFAFTFQGNKNFKLSEPDQLSNINKVEFFDSEGLKYNISDFSGKIILINFWATWCLPCRAEMPSLDNLQRKIGDDTFQVIIVAIERTSYSKIANFLDEIGIKSIKNFHDPTTQIGQQINAKGLPITLVVNKKGKEIGRFNGPLEWDSHEVVDYLTNLKLNNS